MSKSIDLIEFLKKVPPQSYSFFRIINHLADLLDGIPDPFFNPNIDKDSKIEDLVRLNKAIREQTIQFELNPFQEDDQKFINKFKRFT